MESNFYNLLKKALKGEETDYTKGNIKNALILLSIPMILEMGMEALFAIVDVFFVAKISNEAVATVGITESILMLVESIAIGICTGATALIARRIGEKKIDDANLASGQAIFLGVLISLVFGGIAFLYAETILSWMNASPELISQGSDYFRIILGFNIVLTTLFINNAIFRSAGNPAVAMRTLWLANGINIVLDPCLIFGLWIFPEMGLTGAAVASTFGRFVGVCYQSYFLYGNKIKIRIKAIDLLPVKEIINKLIKLSAGGAGQFLISTGSWIFLIGILGKLGDDILAGYTIAIRVIIFFILPSWGLANATATLVGQNLGAGQTDRAEKTVWMAAKYNCYLMILLTILFLTASEIIVGFFAQDPFVMKEASIALKIIGAGYIFYGYQMIIGNAFNGAGDTFTPTLLNFISFWLFQIPVAYLLSILLEWGSTGVYVTISMSSALMALMAVFIFRKGKWKTTKV